MKSIFSPRYHSRCALSVTGQVHRKKYFQEVDKEVNLDKTVEYMGKVCQEKSELEHRYIFEAHLMPYYEKCKNSPESIVKEFSYKYGFKIQRENIWRGVPYIYLNESYEGDPLLHVCWKN